MHEPDSTQGELYGTDTPEQPLEGSSGGESALAAARQLASLPGDQAMAAVAELGRSREATAPAPLRRWQGDESGASKALRKEARRALHRLRAIGVAVPRATRE